jgi:hypothetical protein
MSLCHDDPLKKDHSQEPLLPVSSAGPFGRNVIILNSAVKEDENGAGTQKHEGF